MFLIFTISMPIPWFGQVTLVRMIILTCDFAYCFVVINSLQNNFFCWSLKSCGSLTLFVYLFDECVYLINRLVIDKILLHICINMTIIVYHNNYLYMYVLKKGPITLHCVVIHFLIGCQNRFQKVSKSYLFNNTKVLLWIFF